MEQVEKWLGTSDSTSSVVPDKIDATLCAANIIDTDYETTCGTQLSDADSYEVPPLDDVLSEIGSQHSADDLSDSETSCLSS